VVRALRGSSRCNTSILKQLPRTDAESPNAIKRGQPLNKPSSPLQNLGALCASVVKSSSSATSSHALRLVEAVGDGGTTSEANPLAYSCLSGIDYPYLAVSFAANSSDARGGELNDSQRIWLQQKR